MIGSLGNLMFKLGIIFVVIIRFPQATFHMIVPSTEERYSLIRRPSNLSLNTEI